MVFNIGFVRESAYITLMFRYPGNRLVIMNMSQQTDSSDLLGGWVLWFVCSSYTWYVSRSFFTICCMYKSMYMCVYMVCVFSFFSYKPVQLTHIVAPLRERFEKLFQATFSLKQNAQFLASVQVWLLYLACICHLQCVCSLGLLCKETVEETSQTNASLSWFCWKETER